MTGDLLHAAADGIAPERDGAAPEADADRPPAGPIPIDLYRVVVESSPDAIVLADVTGRYVDANAKALALLGYGREEFLRLSIRDTAALGPSWAVAELERFRRDGHWEGAVELRTKHGALVAVDVRAVVLSAAKPPLYAAFLRDRQEPRHGDLTRARLAAIVRSSADAIVGETLDGIITDWNPAAERLYGFTAAEVLGQPLTLLAPPEREAEIEALLTRVVGGESIEHLETVRRTKSGQLVPVALTLSPVRDERGEVIAASAIVRDIAGQKESARALAMSEARFRMAFENAPIGKALTSADGRPLQVNHALCAILGYSEQELLARTVWDFTHPDDVPANQEVMRQALAGEIDDYTLEKRYLRNDGRVIWVSLAASLVRDEEGAPLYFIAQLQDITARKAAEDELAATHQNTRQVLDRISDGFYALDTEWCFTYVNDAAERILERPRRELLGRSIWEAFPPAVETALYPAYHRALTDGRPTTIELYYLPLAAWLEVRAYPSRNGLSVFFQDITERRRLEEELRASETRFRTLVEQVPAVVYVLAADENQTPLYYNPYIEQLIGVKPEAAATFKEHWLTAAVHPDDRERVAAEEARTGPLGLHFSAEYRHRRQDGSYVWVHDECVPIRDDTGKIVAWQGVMFDISARMQADETRAQLAAIVESAEDAIISRTLDGFITSWNRGAERLYGYTADEMIGRPIKALLPEGEEPVPVVALEALGPRAAQFEGRRTRKDGRSIDVAVSLSPIRDAQGALVGVSTIARDVTERKRMEEDLRAALDAAQAAHRATTHFLGMMSHELRTPMQAVLGYADLLLADTRSLSPQQREDVQYIKQGAARMMRLVEQMLSLSRLEAGRLDVNLEPVDLGTVCAQVRKEIAPLAAGKGLALVIDLPPELPPVVADVAFLHQILLNLVENAVKFTERGEVRISARDTGEGLEILVSDTGIGIAADALPHIFDEFWQVDGGLTRRFGGAGLGLAITRKLVELHGGSLAVTSQLGFGSTFTVHLPGQAIPSREEAPEAAPSVQS